MGCLNQAHVALIGALAFRCLGPLLPATGHSIDQPPQMPMRQDPQWSGEHQPHLPSRRTPKRRERSLAVCGCQ